MDNNLTTVLEFANYQSSLKQQKEILKQKFKDDCIYAHNGGLFLPDFAWLAGINNINEDSQWIIDINGNPIWVEDVKEFYRLSYQNYVNALDQFGTAYQALRTQRSVKSLVGL
jgi:hypothetical protein